MACVFNKQLLHPRNWLTWFGLGILWLIVQLPYPLLHFIGTSAGRLSRRFLKRREHIARRNIELCFPDMSPAARETLIDQNFTLPGWALAKASNAWFWSDGLVKKWFDVEGFANLNHALSGGKGVMVVGVHFMSLELGGCGVCPRRAINVSYRPHNSPLMEWALPHGDLRSNKAMIDRNNLTGLVHALKSGEAVWFAPDQDYGPKGSVFAPFFSAPSVATANGTYVLSRLSGAKMLSISMVRKLDRRGYSLHISEVMNDYPGEDKQIAAGYINKVIEREILRAPEQYLWVHRRFKTRPLGEPSV
ncbi:LpxL/LpxP family Kdo(2)-lipid IV(A) lauroyl/palmitoleoyl acyltransferase [Klebsiella pneumoniae]|uniref:LpxL/LpxP family Kdo(2)-lipid IV(A) lauroyl/palmitoleoyl acyltransferase n=1 Tax=Klebsiella pneumoniae TaxID=573 RepID=UPI00398751A8